MNKSRSRKAKESIRISNEIKKLTGEYAQPFEHRKHRKNKKRIKMANATSLYKKKVKRLKDKDIKEQLKKYGIK